MNRNFMVKMSDSIRNDIIIQFRSGFYYAYLLISIIYIIVLKLLPKEILDIALTETIFTDPSVFGYFFMGALIMLEKDQHTLEALFVTPIETGYYILSKVISLTFISLLTSFTIVIFVKGINFNPILLFTGVTLSSTAYILLGIALSFKFKNFSNFLFLSIPILIIICIPMIEIFKLFKTPFFYILPGKASIVLINSAFVGFNIFDTLYGVVYLTATITLCYFWADSSIKKNVLIKV